MRQALLITGGTGLLGRNWALAMRDRFAVVLATHERQIRVAGAAAQCVDLASRDDIRRAIDDTQAAALIHTAGLTNVEACERDPALARHVNVELSRNVAQACASSGIALAHISTDHLFSSPRPLASETEPVEPINVYARTKADAEIEVQQAHPQALIVRTNFFGWGPSYRRSFSDVVVAALRTRTPLTLFSDVFFTPILMESLIRAVHELIELRAAGVFNVVGDERVSKYEFGCRIAACLQLDAAVLGSGKLADRRDLVPRPREMSLSNDKLRRALGRDIGRLDEQLQQLFRQERQGLGREVSERMIPYGRHYIDEDDIAAVAAVLRDGNLTQGPAIERFERAVCERVGAKYGVAVASCTAGLHLAALAAGVGPGKTLVTSPITFVASANAGLYVGGSVAFADIDLATVNMSPARLREVLRRTPNVRAIVPVHFAGLPCDVAAIRAAADEAGAVVIEDAAHALGARHSDGSPVGSCKHSLMTVFSFHPVKLIAAGEGGLVTTNDESVYRRLLRLRSHGINKAGDAFQLPEQAGEDGVPYPWYYEMQELGFHYRITDIQCSLARSQLAKLDRFLARRRQLVAAYDTAFASMRHCRPAQSAGRDRSGHHLYVLRIDFAAAGKNRTTFMKELRERDIGSQVHYIPVPAQPHYRRLGFDPSDYPDAEQYYREALSIPLFFGLSDEQQQWIIRTVRELLS